MKHYLKKLEEQIHLRPGKPALCDYCGSAYTYAEVATLIEKYHIFFQAAGVHPGDKIAICARNSARWAIFFLAVNTYEAVIVPILPNFTAEGTMQLISHSDSILLMADADIWSRMSPESLPQIRAVLDAREDRMLWFGDERMTQAWNKRDELFDSRYQEGFKTSAVCYHSNMEEVAIINYTSGTSGDPKGVMLSFGSMSDIVEFCQQHIYNAPEILVSMLPLAHIYGLAMEFIYPCCTGFTIHFLGKTPSPSLLLKSMQELQPYLVVTVPLVMEKLYNTLVRPQLATRSARVLGTVPGIRTSFYRGIGDKLIKDLGGRVKTIIIGGAPLSWKIESAFRKIGLPYTVGYGMTEACPLLALSMPPDTFVTGSCGKPIHEIRIDSSDPERIPGEIQSRGPNITLGYYKNPEADAKAHTADGWFRTGDLGVMDEDGNLFIRGRIKALILSASGQNIYPEEIEQVLSRNKMVEESLVVEREGKIIALVYPRGGTLPGMDEADMERLTTNIRDMANRHLPNFSQIFRVELMDVPFERTAKGSIKRHLYQ